MKRRLVDLDDAFRCLRKAAAANSTDPSLTNDDDGFNGVYELRLAPVKHAISTNGTHLFVALGRSGIICNTPKHVSPTARKVSPSFSRILTAIHIADQNNEGQEGPRLAS